MPGVERAELEYPSRRSGGLAPPNPVLLDTCVIQHLSYVVSVVDWDCWTDDAVATIVGRLSAVLAVEVLALMSVLQHFSDTGNLVWAASHTAAAELARANGPRALRSQRQWQDLHQWWQGMLSEWPEDLAHTIEPVAQQVSPDQLRLPLDPEPQMVPLGSRPFGPFRDAGDRALILEARRRGFRAILTTDLRSLWRHRQWLFPELEIWRPSDVMRAFGGRPQALIDAIG